MSLLVEVIAATVGESLLTVRRWRRRYIVRWTAVEGRDPPVAGEAIDGQEDQPHGSYDLACDAAEGDSLERAQHGYCDGHLLTGISYSRVQWIWHENALKPHLVGTLSHHWLC